MGAAPILTILKNGETVKSLSIEGEMVLGRSEGCVIRLEDRAISRQHAIFRPVGDGIQVEKRSEFAPLKVNGNECTRAVIKEGDVIAIGPYLMKMTLPKLGRSDAGARPAVSEPLPDMGLQMDMPAALVPQSEGALGGMGEAFNNPGSITEDPGLELNGAAPVQVPESAVGEHDPFAGGMLEMPPMEDHNGNLGEALPGVPLEPIATSGFENNVGLGGTAELRLEENIDAAAPVDSQEGSGRAAIGGDDAATRFVINPNLDARLIIPEGFANVTEFALDKDEVVIGRGKNCDIVLDDKKSSRRNTLIRREQGRFIIKDLDSANGTWVNGERIDEQVLSGDDVIKVGLAEFTFRVVRGDYAEQEKDFLQIPPENEEPVQMEPHPSGHGGGGVGGYGSAQGQQNLDAFGGMAGHQQPVGMPPPFGVPEMGGEFGAVPGLNGIGSAQPKKKQTLMEKFRALPKRRQYIWIAVVIGVLYFLLFDEDSPVPKTGKNGKKGVTAVSGQVASAKDQKDMKDKGLVSFESLNDKDRQFVIAKHELAFDYYRNKEYDKALFELSQLFTIVQDYKDSREIERYAKEGKRKLEAFEEEKRHREEEARLKARIEQLIEETNARMAKKQYEQAKELFGQILAMDPENPLIAGWRKAIEDFEEEGRLKDQQKVVRAEINRQALGLYKEALKVKAAGRLKTAIALFGNVLEINAPDPKISQMARAQIAKCHAEIKAALDPIMAEAKQQEDAGDFAKAFQLYLKASKIDASFKAAIHGMDRIRGVLHERSKTLYVEAVLAESYSDFSTARKKFGECLVTAPPDDIYHDRAERKLARFLKKEEPAQ